MVIPAFDAAERSNFWQDVVFVCLSAIIPMTSILLINSQISSPPPRVIDSEPLKVNSLLSAVVKLQIYTIYFCPTLYLNYFTVIYRIVYRDTFVYLEI
jgi:hypothetical protein